MVVFTSILQVFYFLCDMLQVVLEAIHDVAHLNQYILSFVDIRIELHCLRI